MCHVSTTLKRRLVSIALYGLTGAITFSPFISSLEAFGPGGGGGRGNSGSGREGVANPGVGTGARTGTGAAARAGSTGPAINRGPSMTRSAPVNRVTNTQASQLRAQGIERGQRAALRQPGQAQSQPKAPAVIQQPPSNQPQARVPGTKTFRSDWKQQWSARSVQGDQLRSRVQNYNPNYLQRGLQQGNGWWNEGRHAVGSDWRRNADWGGLNSWLGWDSEPLYYDEDGSYYSVPDTMYAPAPVQIPMQSYGTPVDLFSYSIPSNIRANEVIVVQQDEGALLPLGFFVATSGGVANAVPKWYFELAVDAQGYLYGYVYNAALDRQQALTGVIDQETQEASWSIQGQTNSPYFYTGAYNLTQNETTVQMIYPGGSTTTLFLVRMNRSAVLQ